MRKLKIRDLESFLQVAETGSFRRAAELLHRSPSAVSAHVQQLEEQLEVTLLERTTRRVVLTNEGRHLLEHCERILSQLDTAALEVRDEARSSRKRVSMGISPSISRHLLLPAIAAFEEEEDGCSVELHEAFAEKLYTDVRDRLTEFAIGPGIDQRADFHVRPIIEDDIVAVLPRSVRLSGNRIAFSQLEKLPQIAMPTGTAIRDVVESAFRAQGARLRVQYEVMYPQGLFELVEAGMGAAMMPMLSLPPAKTRRFRIAKLEGPRLVREMCLISPRSRKLSPNGKRLADRLVETLKKSLDI